MEQPMTLRFCHYEDEELAVLAAHTVRRQRHKAQELTTGLKAFRAALKRAEYNKVKEHKRGELENRLANILDNLSEAHEHL